MKTFKQYLLEEIDYELMIDILRRDCGPWLKQAHNHWAMRGMKSGDKAPRMHAEVEKGSDDVIEYSKHMVRKDRKPKDMNKNAHAFLDDYFEEKFGIKARSQTMFCFGFDRRRSAKEYGEPYMIFPIGDFDYLWTPHVEDLYSDIPTEIQGAYGALKDGWDDSLREYMDSVDYRKNRGLASALNGTTEIMVRVDSFYAIHETFRQKMEKMLGHHDD